MEDTYKTIINTSESIYKDKGSKFIAIAIPIKNQNQIKNHLNFIRKKYHDASHHCYAWALGLKRENHRFNDDGEPSGTAGKPIYGQILSYNITNVLIVVIRYFGGTKLGKGGLINAYKNAASGALNNNRIVTETIREIYRVSFDYTLMNDIMKIFKENDLMKIDQKFELDCSIDFEIRKKNVDKILSLFNKLNNIKIERLDFK